MEGGEVSFKPGDKVVCVDDSSTKLSTRIYPNGYIIRGKVYVVTEFFLKGQYCARGHSPNYHDSVSILGKPIVSSISGDKLVWNAYRFRLVSEVGHPPIAATITAAPEFESEKQREK